MTVNFHANQGIIHFYDSKMNVYHDFEPMQHGSMMLAAELDRQERGVFRHLRQRR